MDRSVADKMLVQGGERVYLLNAPPDTIERMRLPTLDFAKSLQGDFDLIFAFFKSQAGMRADFPRLKKHLREGGRLWACWPKARKLGSDLTLPKVIEIGYDCGLVESTALKIDETWSALKFTHPRPGKVYANSYGTLPD